MRSEVTALLATLAVLLLVLWWTCLRRRCPWCGYADLKRTTHPKWLRCWGCGRESPRR